MVWADEVSGDEFYTCPLRLIPTNITDWYEEYTYCCKFYTTLPYHDQCAAWIEAMLIYESEANAYREIADKAREAASRSNIG